MTILVFTIIALLSVVIWSFWALWRDYKKRIEITEELRTSEEKFRTIAEQSMLAISIVQDRIIKYANEGNSALSEYANNKIVGLTLREYKRIVHPDDRSMVIDKFNEYESNPEVDEGKLIFRLITKSGKIKWAEAFMKKFQFEGNPAHFLTILDVTAKVQAEKKLRESESRYRVITDNATDIIWTMDLNECFTFLSPAIKRILGYSVEEAMALKMEKVLAPSSYQSARDLFAEYLIRPAGDSEERDSEPVVLELEHVCKNGSTKWCEVSNLLLRDEKKNPIGLIGVTRDISERKASQEKLLHYQERLRALTSELSMVEQRERRKIAADLHDRIGQTLAAAKIKLGTLRVSMPPDFLTSDVNDIIGMIDETMRDTRTLTFELSPPILYELGLVAAVDWLLEEIGESYGINCVLDAVEEPLNIDDDMRVRIFRIIRELIINVTKHAHARNLNISLNYDGVAISVEVVDDGEGFDLKHVKPDDFRNVGFGLFNVRERLEHIGGQFTISSALGEGTKVAFSVPVLKLLDYQPMRRVSDHK